MWEISSGLFLGGTLGANDTSNVFGTAVATKVLTFENAVALTSLFVVIGAFLEGERGIATYSLLADHSLISAFITSLAAALTVSLMTYLSLPVSTSQAVVGAIIGSAVIAGELYLNNLSPIIIAWVLTPVGALVISFLLYKLYLIFLEERMTNIQKLEFYIKVGLIISGIYGAYSLGANNVANVVGVYVAADLFDPQIGSLIGGMSIGLGVIYSKRVMYTVGNKITTLTPLTALIAVFSHSITLYIYARIGIPVSSSQAIVGAVIGIGLVKGMNMLDWQMAKKILFGWIGTPSVAAVLGIILSFVFL